MSLESLPDTKSLVKTQRYDVTGRTGKRHDWVFVSINFVHAGSCWKCYISSKTFLKKYPCYWPVIISQTHNKPSWDPLPAVPLWYLSINRDVIGPQCPCNVNDKEHVSIRKTLMVWSWDPVRTVQPTTSIHVTGCWCPKLCPSKMHRNSSFNDCELLCPIWPILPAELVLAWAVKFLFY